MLKEVKNPKIVVGYSATTAIVATLLAMPLHAQVVEVSRAPIADIVQITFGYRCDDRFVIRNDGALAVDVAYAVEKSNVHSKLTLNARELVELDSKSNNAMELWMDGKLIAKADKDKRSCKDVQGTATVAIAPLEVKTGDDTRSNNSRIGPYPFYDPFRYGAGYGYYGGFGYSPFYRGYFGSTIIISNGRGGGVRGGGRRR